MGAKQTGKTKVLADVIHYARKQGVILAPFFSQATTLITVLIHLTSTAWWW
ncbi:MAG: hypothetical protein H6R25_1349 [Proteobacteria bacterium]|nr:hypothetical protein [Pseudomonadota bacterium]